MVPVKQKLIAPLLVLLGFYAHAQQFDFNPACRQAYNTMLALKINQGRAMLKLEEQHNPNNFIAVYLENYADFLLVYTTESRRLYDSLKKNEDLRLALIASGDATSPYYLFTQAEINLQWAALNLQFGEYMNAVFGIRRAFKMLEQNRKKFPGFRANEKSLGVLYALLGSVPDKYKWGVTLLGMEGNVPQGMGYLSGLMEYSNHNDFIYRNETIVYDAFLLQHLEDSTEQAWQLLQNSGLLQTNNLLGCFIGAHVGIYGHHTDEALLLLQNRPQPDTTTAFPFLDYLQGLGKLNRQDADAASYFKKFLAEYKGENHVKAAYQKIAWCYLLQADTANYFHFIEKAVYMGNATLDADKQARKEAEAHRTPNVDLLRARLLCDGGYYNRAAGLMNRLTENNFTNPDDKTEYLYRLGRIYADWGKTDSALVYYQLAFEKGRNITRYFAANAAYESGRIYEQRNDKQKAIDYYNLCLSLPDHEYKDGLDQKAKAGLNRLK
ncbi:MAG TPA: hypothetical protein VG603_01520 [Chitinophagales bacterium]|nr:hypothetical protein [Chitinophagales bacterium]